MLEKARQIVYDYYTQIDPTSNMPFTINDVYVVWFCKTLQNWKALVSTTVDDGRYYEVTYNGDKKETYLDVYVKWQNIRIED